MQWNNSKAFAIPGTKEAVDALFHRFGTIASMTGHVFSGADDDHDDDDAIFDEAGSIEKCDNSNRVRLNRVCIRRLVGIFFIFYRHMHCWSAHSKVQDISGRGGEEEADCGIKLHHILAASDDFSKLSMHWDLIPAAKLNYIHDFRGLFNCVSQVCIVTLLFKNCLGHLHVFWTGRVLSQPTIRAKDAGEEAD